ncbi:MAG: tautomerase family protein [Clostridia bacterium]|nr:tautomerase family protein [Clostridia bacterium]MCI1999493.1 tautomerase family protein [Clostridia bacterium]MCI2014128.1 tautomerase family protein [Clostridia bacterium]
MPAIKIEMGNKWKIETAVSVKNIVMAEVKNIFGLNSADRNIRVIRYDQDLFELKDPYEIFIEIQLVTGKNTDFKRQLYKNIVSSLEQKTIFKKENILIFLNEQPSENWGVKGGIAGCDIM